MRSVVAIELETYGNDGKDYKRDKAKFQQTFLCGSGEDNISLATCRHFCETREERGDIFNKLKPWLADVVFVPC